MAHITIYKPNGTAALDVDEVSEVFVDESSTGDVYLNWREKGKLRYAETNMPYLATGLNAEFLEEAPE